MRPRGPAQLDLHDAKLVLRPAGAVAPAPTAPRSRRRSAGAARAPRLQAPAALQPHRPPGTNRGRSGRKARGPAEQHRAKEAQVALGDQPRAPARARTATLRQQRREGAAADRQLVARSIAAARRRPCAPHRQRVSREHRVALEDTLAVEIHLGDRRDPIQAQAHLFTRPRRARASKLVRNHQSSPSKPCGSPSRHRPASRSAPAAVPGTRAGEPVSPSRPPCPPCSARRGAGSLPSSRQHVRLVAVHVSARAADRRDRRFSRRRHRAAPSPHPRPLPALSSADSGSKARRRASLNERTLQPSTIRWSAREAGPAASPSSHSA